MKKWIVLLLALAMTLVFAGCGKKEVPAQVPAETITQPPPAVTETVPETVETEPPRLIMTYEEYMAAEVGAPVTVETYVQASQSWWDNTVSLYCQDPDGAYFLFCMECTEADAARLVPGTRIIASGYKSVHGGEVEILGGTLEIVEDGDTFLPEPVDLTGLLGSAGLAGYQNQLASFQGLTVEAIEYENGEPGGDIFLTLSLEEENYHFLVESYLTGPDSEVYTAVGSLRAGRKVDVEGFLCWSEDRMTPHITAIGLAK